MPGVALPLTVEMAKMLARSACAPIEEECLQFVMEALSTCGVEITPDKNQVDQSMSYLCLFGLKGREYDINLALSLPGTLQVMKRDRE